MIEVQNLTKLYDERPAVTDISFSVPRGQVLGFLGPNGAGKSTTMRILCGYLGATSGRASIAGFDVFEKSLEVRRRVERLLPTLELEPLSCIGSSFDPELMEVVEVVGDTDQPAGTVVEEVRPGYLWRGRLFRFAQVKVAR